jgi:hypothetical protein
MRAHTWWLKWLLTTGVALIAQAVHAQTEEGAIPDPVVPLPLYHNHPAKGGFFTLAEFVMFRQTNPLEHQPIAYRGFVDATGDITGTVGQWVGSRELALDAKDAGGPGTFLPGLKVGLGYRFQDGATITFDWMWLQKAVYFHVTNNVPPGFNWGQELENSFITAPVYNFSNWFIGPPSPVQASQNFLPEFATYGIWNAAAAMTIEFDQRTQQWELTYRKPIFDTEYWRGYGLVGPRFFWIWERFKWITEKQNVDGQSGPLDNAIYTNIVSNRMYGLFVGCGNDWFLGNGFSVSLDLQAAGYLDIVKKRAKYELGQKDMPGSVKRARTDYTLVPEFRAELNLWYYPIEGVQVRIGYNVMAFFNTVAGSKPVCFDAGALDPNWERQSRWFDGLNVGIALIF